VRQVNSLFLTDRVRNHTRHSKLFTSHQLYQFSPCWAVVPNLVERVEFVNVTDICTELDGLIRIRLLQQIEWVSHLPNQERLLVLMGEIQLAL